MKTYFYYERDEEKRPMITHCLLQNFSGTLSKGIAKCSSEDSPCKAIGRLIAEGRALKAMLNDCSQMDKGQTFWKKISHGDLFPHLTEIDKRILKM
jgi:hypothetical protein